MFKSISFVLVGSVVLLSSLGSITIFPNALAVGGYDKIDQNMRYVDNMANNHFHKSQESDNLPSSTLQSASTISPVQQQSTDSPLIFYGNDPSIISQAIGNLPELIALEKQPADSPDLTAMEKITKLKIQWLGLLR
jgi:hypothetical protein